jgi:hypothetical protein
MNNRYRLTLFLCFALSFLNAQNRIVLAGKITNSETTAPIADATVVISKTGKFTNTDPNGTYNFEGLLPGSYKVIVNANGFLPAEVAVTIPRKGTLTQNFTLTRGTQQISVDELPTITLDEAEAETEGAGEVANLLHASRDVFQNSSNFGWSIFRFRERGYDSGLFQLYLNGVPFNDPETGWTPYAEFGGLNDVLRNRASSVGLDATEFAFGDVGGNAFIDTRALNQRKQIRASYAVTNRLYRNRLMLTASSGLMPGGWAVSASVSKRWAQEGYVPGTFFDGYAYFLAADNRINSRHHVNVTLFGAPTKRGRSADSFQEMYDIAGTNYYNPLWGYQNGQKRNAQVSTNHQPTGIVRYDFTPTPKTRITAAGYGQFGLSGFTRINWLNATNPAPDFNRRLPSSLPDSTLSSEWAALLSQEENARQIDWEALYEANQNNLTTVQNANGSPGSNITGKRAAYIIENQHADNQELGANVTFTHALTNRLNLNGGTSALRYTGRNYKTVEDLLGADFWTDWDFFGQFDPSDALDGRQSDLRIPNHLIKTDERFGYDYNENIRKGSAWIQAQWNLRKLNLNLGAEGVQTVQWRTGRMLNGRFPNSSLGNSEKLTWNTYALKGGATYKFTGRHFAYAHGYYGTKAPLIRNIFVSPRVRNTIIPHASVSQTRSLEAGYLLRSPNLTARITGYFTEFINETESIFSPSPTVSRVLAGVDLSGIDLDDDQTFLQVPIFFGGSILQGVNRQHAGLEIGIEAKPQPSWIVTAAASLGKYIYTSRPTLYLAPDNIENLLLDGGLVYQKNFFVPRTPQTAAAFSMQYLAPKFWRAALSVNYVANMYYDFDRSRRTARFVDGITPESPIWNTVIEQQKAPSAFTLDFFASKSWKITDEKFIYLNVGINNLLDNQNIIVAGRESYRNAFRYDINDPRFYTSERIYAPGINYFISLAYRM